MSDSDISQIKDRLIRLETQVEEKWTSHDRRADERWSDLMDKMHEMGKKVDARPCHEHSEAMITLNAKIKAIEAWQTVVNWAVGVIYVAVVGFLVSKILG